jgi:aryl-alcohol dehydrogenase-like predicted oxidoreductase
MKRRQFLHRGTMAGSALLALRSFPHPLYAGTQRKTAQDVVTLGKTGIRVSRLAQGTGTNGFGGSSNQVRLGARGFADLLRAGAEHGLTFWDLADDYGSHPGAKEALKTVPRDRVVLLTKTEAAEEKTMRADLDRFRRELGVDVIDIVLLHCMFHADWPRRQQGPMAVLSEAKDKGLIRAHGVSCHSLRALKTAAATPWVDVQLARLNQVGVEMDADPSDVVPVLADMKRQGKGVIGMKILGAGFLKDERDPALQFALAQDVLDCFTIGAESRGQLEDLIAKIPAASVRG